MIVISDIHGRSFWEDAVREHENELIVFLGDYHDPYITEGITKEESIENFKKIINFKKEHMDNVILLIGNHDFHYLHKIGIGSRFDYTNRKILEQLLKDNIHLFQMAYFHEFKNRNIIFSHAGIIKPWFEGINEEFNKIPTSSIVQVINDLFRENNEDFNNSLGLVSFYRGGFGAYGSMVWSDVDEHRKKEHNFEDVYQVFGHTQQISDPIITDKFACLDCRRAFFIDDNGDIKENE